MKIAVIGAGPAGLFFANLVKRENPSFDVRVFEQNPRGATYGFGVVFTEGALRPIEQTDLELHGEVIENAERQDKITIHHRNVPVAVNGNVFYGIARTRLLEIMQARCERLDVPIAFEQRIETAEELPGFDLIVAADGINSAIRASLQDHFAAVQEPRQNIWAWYATPHVLDGIHLIFQQTPYGLFIGHGYRYAHDRSGFVVEISPETWRRAGFHQRSDAEGRHFCAEIFREHLEGSELLSNRSQWFTPSFVTSQRWYYGNIVLIGDALKTVHPSIGSGTRVGIQDAIALKDALSNHGYDTRDALPAFAAERKPMSDAFQDAAMRSILWYETIEDKLRLCPVDFAFSYMMRTGRVNYQRLRGMDYQFVGAYESAPSVFLTATAR